MPSTVSSSRLGLAGLCILLAGQLLPMIDFSIVNVALDALAHSLGASETELELIVAVYGVAFAVCLAMGGRLGDNYGRRRLFDLGVALFAVASLLCGLAGSVWLLLVARALQGVGAALIVPQILATLHVSLSGHAHSRALAAYGAIGGLAFVVGQVLGGFLVSADIGGLGWRSVFLINLPICLGILLCSRRWVPETRAEHAARVDAPGTLLLAALILCLLLPLALGPSLHWSWPCALLLAAAVPLLAWLFREPAPDAGVAAGTAVAETALSGSTAPQAWRSASFWLVLGNQVLAVFVMSGIMTHGVPMLVERGLSRGEAGTALSALWVGMMLSQPLMGWLLDRVATPRVALPFALAAVLGMAWFLVGDTPSGLWLAVFLVGLGGGGESGTTKYLLMRYFGLRSFGVIYGSIQPFTFALSISLGAYLLGWLYDRAEGYGTAEWVLLAAFSLAACSLFAFRPYPQKLP
ncbi:MFS transporter [Pseudomonas aeruginosa]|uniref:MFS transporter n=1 Tax=Pseudomonas aeruginosa TaxID=287 RepID=UPI00053D1D1C|nr:MFS transporter [Pseudomonas aeruginosa]